MRSKLILMLLFGGIAPVCAVRSQDADSLRKEKSIRSARWWSREPGMKPTSGIFR